jgi:pyrroline-5-carboxylate reductase
MKKTGIIGYGSIGSIIAEAFLKYEAIKPERLIISTRTVSKASGLKRKYRAVTIISDNQAFASVCGTIFICVKPNDVAEVMAGISPCLKKTSHLVNVAGGWTIEMLGKYFKGAITEACPSVLSSVGEGITLIDHNRKVKRADSAYVEKLFKATGGTVRVNSNNFGIYANMTGCGPGLVAAIASELSKAAQRTGMPPEEADAITTSLLLGVAKMKLQEKASFEDILSRVATKGGITEQGANIIKENYPKTFNEMFLKMFERRKKRS